MGKKIEDKGSCSDCGVGIRENTSFCYNCGSRLVAESRADVVATKVRALEVSENAETDSSEPGNVTRDPLEELADRLRSDDDASKTEKLAQAAEKRKIARVKKRRSNEFAWEPMVDERPIIFLMISIMIAVATALAIFVLVILK